MAARLLTTGQAAEQLGISRRALAGWWADGVVTPAFITPGGHGRWDLDDLRRQVDEWRRSGTADDETPDP